MAEETKDLNQETKEDSKKEYTKKKGRISRSEIIRTVEATNLEKFQKKEDQNLEEEQQDDAQAGKKKKKEIKDERYDFLIGDTIKVFVKIVEGQGKKMRERLQGFEGIVIAANGKGIGKNFTVRKISYGVGVERVFPFNSPLIGRVEITRKGKVRRAKLYYLRDRVGKASQVKRKEYRKQVQK
jgi:large subunit ribosomal protein L19